MPLFTELCSYQQQKENVHIKLVTVNADQTYFVLSYTKCIFPASDISQNYCKFSVNSAYSSSLWINELLFFLFSLK